MKHLISPQELYLHLENESWTILDTSMDSVTKTTENISSINKEVIPGAQIFDLKTTFSDPESLYDQTLPKEDDFIMNCQKLGLNYDSKVIVYDSKGIFSSPRVFFMLKSFGLKDIYVLNGGLPTWQKLGYPIVSFIERKTNRGNFGKSLSPGEKKFNFFCDSDYVLNRLKTSKIIDVRSSGRYHGTEPEPRSDSKSGHIPNAISIPYTSFLTDKGFKDKEELDAFFKPFEDEEELIFSCGSGITACVGALAALIAGHENVKIYDGSWNEWGNIKNDFPIER